MNFRLPGIIRKIKNKNGSVSYQLRMYLEDGERFEKRFRKEEEAHECQRSMATKKIKLSDPDGKIVPTLLEVILEKWAKNKESDNATKRYIDDMYYLMRKSMKDFSWKYSTDLTPDSFVHVKLFYKSTRTMAWRVILLSKIILRFSQNYMETVKIHPRALTFPNKRPPQEEGKVWEDDEEQKILNEFRTPKIVIPTAGTGRHSRESLDQARETIYFERKKAFFPIFELGRRYALRPMELSKILVKNWNPKTLLLTVPSYISKNRSERSFCVDDEMAHILNQETADRGPQERIFRTQRVNDLHLKRDVVHWRTSSFNKMVKEICRRAGVNGHGYMTRHTGVTNIIELVNNDIPVAKEVSGHKLTSQLDRYVHLKKSKKNMLRIAYNNANAMSNIGAIAKILRALLSA